MAETRVFVCLPAARFDLDDRFPASLSLPPSVSSTSELTVLLPGVLLLVAVPRVDRRDAGVLAAADDARAELALLARLPAVLAVKGGSEDATASSSSDSSVSSITFFADAALDDCETDRVEVLRVADFLAVDLLSALPEYALRNAHDVCLFLSRFKCSSLEIQPQVSER